jgi:hypothetical protein
VYFNVGVQIQLSAILFTVWGMVHVNISFFLAMPTVKGHSRKQLLITYNTWSPFRWANNTSYSMAEVIDVEAPIPVFNAKFWIGSRKKYPEISEIPPEVSAACKSILSVPQHVKQDLPKPQLSVIQFIRQDLPPQSTAIDTKKISQWFSKLAPSHNVASLMTRPIPPPNVLNDLDKAFGQQWFDGAQSICDPRYNNGTEYVPLWILTLWKDLSRMVSMQSTWRKSEAWLNREAQRGGEEAESMKKATMLLSAIGWDAPIHALGSSTTTAEFSKLLRAEWISDELMNMMMEDLSFQARTNPTTLPDIKIGTVPLLQAIVRVAQSKNYMKQSAPLLYRYECAVQSSECSQLYLPAHVHGNHWVAIKVDFKKQEVSFGIALFVKSQV